MRHCDWCPNFVGLSYVITEAEAQLLCHQCKQVVVEVGEELGYDVDASLIVEAVR